MTACFSAISLALLNEFLTEANFIQDFENQEHIIIGDNNEKSIVNDLYELSFPDAKIINCDSKEAEMIKYITNLFLATKVSFANEIHTLCRKFHVLEKSLLSQT